MERLVYDMKRFLCTLLTGTLCAALLSGCGKSESGDPDNAQSVQQGQTAQAGQGADLSGIYNGTLSKM